MHPPTFASFCLDQKPLLFDQTSLVSAKKNTAYWPKIQYFVAWLQRPRDSFRHVQSAFN